MVAKLHSSDRFRIIEPLEFRVGGMGGGDMGAVANSENVTSILC